MVLGVLVGGGARRLDGGARWCSMVLDGARWCLVLGPLQRPEPKAKKNEKEVKSRFYIILGFFVFFFCLFWHRDHQNRVGESGR